MPCADYKEALEEMMCALGRAVRPLTPIAVLIEVALCPLMDPRHVFRFDVLEGVLLILLVVVDLSPSAVHLFLGGREDDPFPSLEHALSIV